MYGGLGFDNSRIPNLMALLSMHSGGLPFMGQMGFGQQPLMNGNPAMIPRPMLPMQPQQPQQPINGGPVATPQPVAPGGGYGTLPAQRPALQPQQIQGILQRWGQSSY